MPRKHEFTPEMQSQLLLFVKSEPQDVLTVLDGLAASIGYERMIDFIYDMQKQSGFATLDDFLALIQTEEALAAIDMAESNESVWEEFRATFLGYFMEPGQKRLDYTIEDIQTFVDNVEKNKIWFLNCLKWLASPACQLARSAKK